MKPFDHVTPHSLKETLAILHEFNDQARVIAGGTDLLLNMRNGMVAPSTIINIKKLDQLKGMSFDNSTGLKMGALTTLREITRSSLIQEHYPAMLQAASRMASEQIRSFATIGGNLCNASPAADMAPPLIALGASVHIISLDGERDCALEEFFLGPGVTALKSHELLQEINVPPPKGITRFKKHALRTYMDLSVVSVAIRLCLHEGICREGRIVLGAVAPVPMRAIDAEKQLTEKPLTPEIISQVASVARDESKPIDDTKGSAWYRRQMVEVLVRRGINSVIQELHS